MFPFADSWISPQAKDNPFLALMPGMEPLQKTTETWMRGMGVPEMPRMPEAHLSAMVPDVGAFEANLETMIKAVPGLENLPNLALHPMAAMAATTAVSMGAASQAMGAMFGTVTGMMDAALRMQRATRDVSPFAPPGTDVTNPLKFEWAFGAAGEEIAAAKAATAAAAKATRAATPRAKAKPAAKPARPAVVADTKPAARAADAAASVASKPKPAAAKPAEGAPAAKAKPGAKAKATVTKATVTKTAPAPKVNGAAVAAPAPEPVAAEMPARPGGPTTAEVMPEDFKQPRKIEKPKKPDDLKLITGVGPKLESVLNGLGVWTFTQIADWTAEEIAWLDDYLQFSGRIVRDNWIDQAAKLTKSGKKRGK